MTPIGHHLLKRNSMIFENFKIEELHTSPLQQVEFEKMPKSYRELRLYTKIFLLVLVQASWLMYVFGPEESMLWLVPSFLTLFFSLLVIVEVVSFKYRGWALRNHDITYQSGWLFHKSISVPMNRIQHCETQQGPIMKGLDLANLKIYTAGGSTSDLVISGLDEEIAEELKETIIAKAAQHA